MRQVKRGRGWTAAVAAVLITVPLILVMAPPAGAAPAVCASSSHPALAARISQDILAAQRGRISGVAVAVDDPGVGLSCRLDSTAQFYSASVVKVTILGALLRKAQEQRRFLTSSENALAWAMITRSDNNGWLPLATHGWHVHSIGAFTGPGGGYSIVVLTLDNPTMAYGIATIEAIARVINRDLNPAATARVPSSRVSPTWEIPDEQIPALSR